MQHFKIACILVVTLGLLSGPAWAADAVFLSVEGQVVFQVGGQPERSAKPGLTLDRGSVVISKGGRAQVILSSGTIKRVEPGQRVRIEVVSGKKPGETLLTRMAEGLAQVYTASAGPRIRAMVKSLSESLGKRLFPIFPQNSTILAEDLAFAWSSPDNAASMRITITDGNMQLVYSFEVKEPKTGRAFYPLVGPPLNPGTRYAWQVEGFDSQGAALKAIKPVWFIILDGGTEVELNAQVGMAKNRGRADNPDLGLTLANLYAGLGLYHRADAALKEVLKNRPDHPQARQLADQVAGLMLDGGGGK